MGEVYRARDANLNRDVALKVLPPEFALDANRLARFKREAQVLASLNHPNIAQIYGFEESDPSTSSGPAVHALVLEAAMMALALAVLAAIHFREKAPEPPIEMRVDITTPATFAPEQFALSPDGKSIVFVASGDGPQRLWMRRLDQAAAQPLPGTENALAPFWSPDSRSIGFSASRQIKRLDISGGVPFALAEAFGTGGGSWNADGVILFAAARDIYRIDASGEGKPVKVLQMPGAWILSPQFLPDRQRFLFCVYSGPPEVRGTYIASLDGSTPKRLGPSENGAAWLPPDRVVFVQQGSLWARRLDLGRLQWNGEPDLITDSIGGRSSRRGGFSVSPDGRIAYRKQASISQLTWLDREGKSVWQAARSRQ
jgi:eukaryotic-like serine/threonine-protein kinase